MGELVKTIVKIIVKVMVVIAGSFLVFNLFSFSLNYFRLLGFSYTVQQTVVENNYIPASEMASLNSYLDNMFKDSGVIDSYAIVMDDNERVQYGRDRSFRVEAHFRVIWPLMYNETMDNPDEGVAGMKGSGSNGFASEEELDRLREEIANNVNNNIIIEYTVPGLKYYPDLG